MKRILETGAGLLVAFAVVLVALSVRRFSRTVD